VRRYEAKKVRKLKEVLSFQIKKQGITT